MGENYPPKTIRMRGGMVLRERSFFGWQRKREAGSK